MFGRIFVFGKHLGWNIFVVNIVDDEEEEEEEVRIEFLTKCYDHVFIYLLRRDSKIYRFFMRGMQSLECTPLSPFDGVNLFRRI